MLVLAMSGCEYLQGAVDAENANGAVPWWCTLDRGDPGDRRPGRRLASTTTPAPTRHRCRGTTARRCRRQFDMAKAYALQWPTEGVGRGRRVAHGHDVRAGHGHAPHPRRHHAGDAGQPVVQPDRTRSSTAPGSTTCSTRPSPRCCSTTATARRPSWSASTTTCAPAPVSRRRASRATTTGGTSTR